MSLRVVTFDGLGRPMQPGVVDGAVLILVQRGSVDVVRLEMLSPEEYGPALHHAVNGEELRSGALDVVRSAHPTSLTAHHDVLIECPADLAARARFR